MALVMPMQQLLMYAVPIVDTFDLVLPAESRVTEIGWNERIGLGVMWVMANMSTPMASRRFHTVAHGEPIGDGWLPLGTFDYDTEHYYVFHETL